MPQSNNPNKKTTKKTASKTAKKSANAPARKVAKKAPSKTAKKATAAAQQPDERAAHRWTLDEVMAELEALGTAQNRKIYPRHGVNPDNLFGVSFANYYALAKRIRPATGAAHTLAFQLWDTENHDARMLATMLADPAALEPVEADRWASRADNYVLADAIAALVARSSIAESRVSRWTKASHEYTRRCGYTVLAHLLKLEADPKAAKAAPRNPPKLDHDNLAEHIKTIETDIHDAFNRAAEAMNTCLIAIGTYREDLRDHALAAAERIGAVHIDHGQTNCKTPDAAAYITKAAARKSRSGKAAR